MTGPAALAIMVVTPAEKPSIDAKAQWERCSIDTRDKA